jgi:hypothetical protein
MVRSAIHRSAFVLRGRHTRVARHARSLSLLVFVYQPIFNDLFLRCFGIFFSRETRGASEVRVLLGRVQNLRGRGVLVDFVKSGVIFRRRVFLVSQYDLLYVFLT